VLDKATQQAVRDRAGRRCEYCCFPESFAELPFHFDHVIAQQHGGATTLDNLALACCYCNRYKGPNVASIDQLTGEVVALFNPRRHIWREHFVWQGSRLSGTTDAGRATVQLLQINRADAVVVRQLLMKAGIFSVGR
jgi:hypothetical protein